MENKISQLEVLGDRLIVLLDEAKDHTVTEGGVIVPLFENRETEGGRQASVLSAKKYLPVGQVLAMSEVAKEKLPAISVGDRVYVTPSSATPNYQFIVNRQQLVEDWSGTILISHVLVEAKIKQ